MIERLSGNEPERQKPKLGCAAKTSGTTRQRGGDLRSHTRTRKVIGALPSVFSQIVALRSVSGGDLPFSSCVGLLETNVHGPSVANKWPLKAP